MTLVPLTTLEDSLHTALRQWHKSDSGASPLNKLFLFRQAKAETGNPRQAANKIVLDGLKIMEDDLGHYAQLLRLRFLDQMKMIAVANRLNVAEGTAYKQQKQAIGQLAEIVLKMEERARNACQVDLESRLSLPPKTHLFGVANDLDQLLNQFDALTPPWLLSIEGIGGIGKTTLAGALIREITLIDTFKDVAWVSAKQEEFNPAIGVQKRDQPALDTDTLVNTLLQQLQPEMSLSISPQQKLAALTALLKQSPYFIVVDNLETVTDYQSLLPTLRTLANPSRILLTSRYSLQAYSDVYCFPVKALSQANTLAFLKYEAEVRRIPALANASSEQLESIYQVVGGNPLALKLVAGQIRILPLTQVLENLKQARGKKIDALYSYIYWHAWHALDEISQKVLLLMPLAQDGDFAQLVAISKLDSDQLHESLEKLIALCLVEVSGNLTDVHYHIHRLTETFLLTEVTKWQPAT